jgi:MFS family permease
MDNAQNFTQMWAAQEKIIQKNVQMNKVALKEIKTHKAQHSMRGFLRLNIFSMVVGTLMSSLAGYFMFTHLNSIHMVLSGAIALLWSLLVCIGAVKHLKMQLTLDYSKSVLEVQHQLTEIRLSALYYLRASLMILPFYLAFLMIFVEVLFGIDLYVHGDHKWLISQGIFSVLLGAVAAYLYRQLASDNIDKPIAKLLMQGFGSQTIDAIEELKELEKFEAELK